MNNSTCWPRMFFSHTVMRRRETSRGGKWTHTHTHTHSCMHSSTLSPLSLLAHLTSCSFHSFQSSRLPAICISQDAFFYSLVYDPQQKTLLADKGEIRVGNKYQADITDLLKEGTSNLNVGSFNWAFSRAAYSQGSTWTFCFCRGHFTLRCTDIFFFVIFWEEFSTLIGHPWTIPFFWGRFCNCSILRNISWSSLFLTDINYVLHGVQRIRCMTIFYGKM